MRVFAFVVFSLVILKAILLLIEARAALDLCFRVRITDEREELRLMNAAQSRNC